MAEMFAIFTQRVDPKTEVQRGINPMLVTHFECRPQGGALVYMMGGQAVDLDADQWAVVGKRLLPAAEPSGTPPAAH
jgi:hypothetical protein